jgi:hypothetical protein
MHWARAWFTLVVFGQKNAKRPWILTNGMAGDQAAAGLFAWSVPQSNENGVEEVRFSDWLGEVRSDSQLATTSGIPTNAGGSKHQEDGGGIIGIFSNLLG